MAILNTNIGAGLTVDANAVAVNAAAGTGTSANIVHYTLNARQRKSMSMLLIVKNGAASGTPTSYTIDVAVRAGTTTTVGSHSTVGTANITGPGQTSGVMTQISGTPGAADNSLRLLHVNLKHLPANLSFQYTVAFSGGTSPAVPLSIIPVFQENESDA